MGLGIDTAWNDPVPPVVMRYVGGRRLTSSETHNLFTRYRNPAIANGRFGSDDRAQQNSVVDHGVAPLLLVDSGGEIWRASGPNAVPDRIGIAAKSSKKRARRSAISSIIFRPVSSVAAAGSPW